MVGPLRRSVEIFASRLFQMLAEFLLLLLEDGPFVGRFHGSSGPAAFHGYEWTMRLRIYEHLEIINFEMGKIGTF